MGTVFGQSSQSLARRRVPPAWQAGSCGWTASRYEELLGWTVNPSGGRALLALGRSLVAVLVPGQIAPEVADHLRELDADGPVLAVVGEDPHWVFLADPNGAVVSRDELPAGVVVLDCPSRISIPAVGMSVGGSRWVVPPNPHRRWLPTLAAVLCAVGCRTPLPEFRSATGLRNLGG